MKRSRGTSGNSHFSPRKKNFTLFFSTEYAFFTHKLKRRSAILSCTKSRNVSKSAAYATFISTEGDLSRPMTIPSHPFNPHIALKPTSHELI